MAALLAAATTTATTTQAGCRGEGAGDAATVAAEGDTAGTAEPKSPAVGKVRVADRWVDVSAPILHDPKMDLATRCRLLRDEQRAKGHEVPLCFEHKAGTKSSARHITRIAVEKDRTMARAMQRLTAAGEGTHFVIESTGGIYQVLDLAFSARHGDGYPPSEVRVIACHDASEKALVAALRELYPDAAVETTDMRQSGATP